MRSLMLIDLPLIANTAAGVLVVVFAACWLGAVVIWSLAVKYMLKTMASYRPDRKWGRYVPWSILMSSFFTEEGNGHRVRMWRHLAQFVLFCGAAFGIGMAVKASVAP